MPGQNAAKSSGPIRKDQIKLIHVILAAIKIGDELYRHILAAEPFSVKSCKDLDVERASMLIERLEDYGIQTGQWKRYNNRLKYEDLGYRAGMATPRQLRMIEAMWNDVTYQKTDDAKQRALRRLLWRLYTVSDLRFLEDWQARKVIRTLSAMGGEKQGGKRG